MPERSDDGNTESDRTTGRRTVLAGGLGAVLAGTAGCSSLGVGGADPDQPKFEHPDAVPFDEPFSLTITDLPTGTVGVSVTLRDHAQNEWTARATYETQDGQLSLDETAPIDADHGPGTMALLQRASPDDVGSAYLPDARDADELTIGVEQDGETLGTSRLRRTYGGDGITATEIENQEFVGTLYEPTGSDRAPAVITLHGSEGRRKHNVSRLLARHGYVSLALQYFEWRDEHDLLPQGYVEVPLEFVERAIAFLRGHDRTTDGRVGLLGFSKGGELALLAGSQLDGVGPIASIAGSGYVWPGGGMAGAVPKSTWTYEGEPVPYVPYVEDASVWDGSPPMNLEPGYTASYRSASEGELEAGAIAVENIDAPVLLVSGGEDGLWNAVQFQQDAAERIENAGGTANHLIYEDAGHLILPPYRPATNRHENQQFVYGGTPAGYAEADADHWPRVLEVFEQLR